LKHIAFIDREYEVLAATFSPDGSRLAAAGSRGQIRVWNTGSGQEAPRPAGHTRMVRALRYSPGGRYLASGADDDEVSLWDAASGRKIRRITPAGGNNSSCWAVSFSPDGRRLAAAFNNLIQIEDVTTGAKRNMLRGHAVRVYSLAYSPNGRRLASASKDGTVRLWDSETGRELLRLSGHTDWVSCVAFGPRGRLLFSGSRDGTVRVWLASPWLPSEMPDP
jgi:WD40 repeat protein